MPRIKLNDLLYVISMTFAFTTEYGDIHLGYYHQIIIAGIWILIAVIQAQMNHYHVYDKNWQDIKFFLKLYLTPHIIIHMYSFFLIAAGKMSPSSITTNLTVYIPITMAILAIYLFKEKAFLYTIAAMVCSWVLSVFSSMILKGVTIFPQAIIQSFFDPNAHIGGLTKNYLELHDLVLAIGYILVYVFFLQLKLTKKRLLLLTIILLVMTLGMKRGSIVGLLMAVFFNILFHRWKGQNKLKACKLAGYCGIILCYLFIYFIWDGTIFYDIIDKLGINIMGRNYYYDTIMKYADFSPAFLGIGRNVTYEIFSNELAYLRVGGTHSDIIKMYVENGFILFGAWLWYLLIHMTIMYKKKFGEKSSYLYFGVLIYMFMLYFTDNTENYFICQVISTMMPVSYAMYKLSGYKRETLLSNF